MNKLSETIQIPITPQTLSRLRKQAEKERRSLASVGRFAIEQYLNEKECGDAVAKDS